MVGRLVLVLIVMAMLPGSVAAQPAVSFDMAEGKLEIRIDGKPFGTYVWRDPQVLRPYFNQIVAPNGKPVTRTHPPVAGTDATDHATMHPGLWLAFGDLGGADFWRNKHLVQHVEFVDSPKATNNSGSFAVRNRYVAAGRTICVEHCRITLGKRSGGYLLDWTSTFSGPADFAFGDQEEMGLGIRVATPITVKNGGKILNSRGEMNERQVWGRQADWCEYSGKIDGMPVGVVLMPDPKNFRRSWFHARDYGLLVANLFGQNAFAKGDKSNIVVRRGESLRLRFGVFVYSGPIDVAAVYREWTAAPLPD